MAEPSSEPYIDEVSPIVAFGAICGQESVDKPVLAHVRRVKQERIQIRLLHPNATRAL